MSPSRTRSSLTAARPLPALALEHGTKAALADDIHRYVKQRLKIEQQSAEIEQRAPRFHLDEEIDIAFLVVVSSRNGTENAHIPGAAMRGHPQDLFPPPVADRKSTRL